MGSLVSSSEGQGANANTGDMMGGSLGNMFGATDDGGDDPAMGPPAIEDENIVDIFYCATTNETTGLTQMLQCNQTDYDVQVTTHANTVPPHALYGDLSGMTRLFVAGA